MPTNLRWRRQLAVALGRTTSDDSSDCRQPTTKNGGCAGSTSHATAGSFSYWEYEIEVEERQYGACVYDDEPEIACV